MLGNFVSRVGGFTASRFDGRTPDGGSDGELELQLRSNVAERLDACEHAMDTVEFRRATSELRALWSLGNEYLQRAEPWVHVKTDRPRAAVAIRTAIQLVRLYAVVAAPFIPDAASAILSTLGLPPPETGDWPEDRSAALSAVLPGHVVHRPEPLFQKITNDDVAAWQERFGGSSRD